MTSCPWSRLHPFLGCVALFLCVGLAAVAQQPGVDKSKVELAGRGGVSLPKCEYCPDQGYSEDARKHKVEGVVVLLVIVTADGKATNITVVKSPGKGLDEKAIEAVRKWRFTPAMKDGKPVTAQVPIRVSFRLLR